MTQPVPAAAVLAHPTARVVIVGCQPLGMITADNAAGCGWLMMTST
jgi:hypothetical protein